MSTVVEATAIVGVIISGLLWLGREGSAVGAVGVVDDASDGGVGADPRLRRLGGGTGVLDAAEE